MTIHSLADVQTDNIGANTVVWQFAIILKGAVLGENCNINCHTFIENDVVIGNNVTVKSGVYLWDGIVVEDDVFIGPNVTFINDKYPRSKKYPSKFQKTILKHGSSIGANATIVGETIVGEFAIIGAGSVVTKNVPAYALVKGNPAKITCWVDEEGNKLEADASGELVNQKGEKFIVRSERLVKL